jgi:hypothetical protein
MLMGAAARSRSTAGRPSTPRCSADQSLDIAEGGEHPPFAVEHLRAAVIGVLQFFFHAGEAALEFAFVHGRAARDVLHDLTAALGFDEDRLECVLAVAEEGMVLNAYETLDVDLAHDDFALFDVRQNLIDERAVTVAVVDDGPFQKLVIGKQVIELFLRYKAIRVVPFAIAARAGRGGTREMEFGVELP